MVLILLGQIVIKNISKKFSIILIFFIASIVVLSKVDKNNIFYLSLRIYCLCF